MAKLKIAKGPSGADLNANYIQGGTAQEVDRYVSPIKVSGNYIGGVGGLSSLASPTIDPTVKIGSNAAAAGSILAQKGIHKFRVTDGTNYADCKLVNLPTPTVANTMSIMITLATITSASLAAANVAGGASSTYVTWTGTDVTGPVATPRVGDYITGITGGNIATYAQVTAVNTTTNVSIAVSGNIASQSSLSISDVTFASKINNKYVWDFSTDGSPITTTSGSGFTGTGYNPTRFRYWASNPASGATGSFVQVATA